MTKPVITTRVSKGEPLTFVEMDDNLTNLRDATIGVTGDSGTTQTVDLNGTLTIAGGTGISTIASSNDTLTVNLDNTAVTPGSYTFASITVDAQGRVTAASSGTDAVTSVNGATGAVSLDTDDVSEGTTNKYFSNTLARGAISVTDAGGDGSLSYNNTNGVITYTGPSASEVRSHFSGGTGITITDGVVATTITQYTDTAARTAISVTDAGGEGSLSYNNSTGVITYTGPSFSGLEVTSAKNQANGYAGLDSNGKVAAAQLPSYVDDVVEAANFASLPGTGETGKIYVTLDNSKIYRWSGSAYVEISPSPGSTDAVSEGSTNLYFTTQRARDSFSASTGITINNGAIATTITQYTDSLARNAVSVTDAGGDGSLSYNSSTGVITYTGPGTSDYRAAFSAGTGISISSGVISSTVTAGITDVVQDTTPQLGGNLDVNGNSIVSVSNGNIVLAPNGTGMTMINNIEYHEKIHSLGTTSGTITPDVANGNVQTITLNGNLTLNAFSNPIAGQSLTLIVNTNGTGRTLTSTMKFAGGTKTLSTTSTIDIISVFYDGTNYWASLSTDFK